jgi:hypothetical protein
MDALTTEIEYDDLVYVLYSIEQLNSTPYKVYYLENVDKKGLRFVQSKKLPTDHIYRGALNWRKRTYIFYETFQIENEFLETEQGGIWKVTPYEILYPQKVGDEIIDQECIELFKTFPDLCSIEDHEVPVVAYLGLGISEIKEQILLQTINEKNGMFGKGYYFTDYDNALYDAYYKEQTDDFLIKLENTNHLSDKEIKDNTIIVKDDSFYHYSHYLGNIPSCNKNARYFIYYYDDDVIYIKSYKPNQCKKEYELRSEDGYVMRYILFLKKHFNNKKPGADSYAYDSQYMIKNTDNFICLSYHFIKKK